MSLRLCFDLLISCRGSIDSVFHDRTLCFGMFDRASQSTEPRP